MAGRKPKPTKLKMLEGNPGKRPLNENEPVFALASGRAPRGLSAGALRFWREVAGELVAAGLLTVADMPAAVMMAEHFSVARQAATKLAADGLVEIDEHGAARKHPLLQVMRDASAAFRQYAVEFGMTPSSRTRVHAPGPVQLDLADLLFGDVADVQVGDDGEGSSV